MNYPDCTIAILLNPDLKEEYNKMLGNEELEEFHKREIINEPTLTMLNAFPCLTNISKSNFNQTDNIMDHVVPSSDSDYSSGFEDGDDAIMFSWADKPIKTWRDKEVTLWATCTAMKLNTEVFNPYIASFCQYSGEMLYRMKLSDFISITSDEDIGEKFYSELQKVKQNEKSGSNNRHDNNVFHTLQNVVPSMEESVMEVSHPEFFNSGYEKHQGTNDNDSGTGSGDESETGHSDEYLSDLSEDLSDELQDGSGSDNSYVPNGFVFDKDTVDQKPVVHQRKLPDIVSIYNIDAIKQTPVPAKKKDGTEKKKVGRPRGSKKPQKGKKIGKLWENIKNWLYDRECNPSIVCWDNYAAGVFRFTDSAKAAKLWGEIKGNHKMTFEKMTRAMRYHYRKEVLKPNDKKLYYQFGEKAYGWRKPNPIL